MKRLTLLTVLLLATSGCAILIPIAKVLAIPIAQHILDNDDKADDDKDESKDDHEEEQPKENC